MLSVGYELINTWNFPPLNFRTTSFPLLNIFRPLADRIQSLMSLSLQAKQNKTEVCLSFSRSRNTLKVVFFDNEGIRNSNSVEDGVLKKRWMNKIFRKSHNGLRLCLSEMLNSAQNYNNNINPNVVFENLVLSRIIFWYYDSNVFLSHMLGTILGKTCGSFCTENENERRLYGMFFLDLSL